MKRMCLLLSANMYVSIDMLEMCQILHFNQYCFYIIFQNSHDAQYEGDSVFGVGTDSLYQTLRYINQCFIHLAQT